MNNYSEVEGDYLAHTRRAIKLRLADDREVWIPLSLILDLTAEDLDSDTPEHEAPLLLEVALWFAEKEGLI